MLDDYGIRYQCCMTMANVIRSATRCPTSPQPRPTPTTTTRPARAQNFFDRYGKMVRYSCAQRVRDMVTSGHGCPSGKHSISEATPLQRYALRWLMARPGVGCAVVGMERPEHVTNALLAMRGE